MIVKAEDESQVWAEQGPSWVRKSQFFLSSQENSCLEETECL